MRDGCLLSARIWMPTDAETEPVPAILEYLPYRWMDFTAVRDSRMHRFYATHGYACVRVDIRGSGNSQGVLRDEYLQLELDDCREVLRWLAAQTWCNGSVGILGLSWGGFNGLQMASLDPPELKAVVCVGASDDRYADDVHYMGGCLLTDNLSWASTMFAYNSCPPDPNLVGEKWRDMWLERLAGSGLWLVEWLKHQRRDAYWRHASICEDYSSVKCPVFIASGWADGYTNPVFRVLEHLKGPRKGLVGAWGHKYPHYGSLAPAIGFLSESVRWWDRWLKGIDNGVDHDPLLTVWMQDSVSPTEAKRPGRWVVEQSWPSPNVHEQSFYLNPGEIVATDQSEPIDKTLFIQSPLSVGLFAGKWMSYGTPADIPRDQREEDGGALVFDSEPLSSPLGLLGAPRVELTLRSDKPIALVAIRLSEVAPDGKATRISFGLLNLAHRKSSEHPSPIEPNRQYKVTVPLNYLGQEVSGGSRLRLSISTSYWPLAWPSPEPVNLAIVAGASRLVLPVRTTLDDEPLIVPPPASEGYPPIATTLLQPSKREWTVIHNLATNESRQEVVNDAETLRLDDTQWEFGRSVRERYSYVDYRYDTVRGEVVAERHFKRGDWRVRTVTRTVLTSSRTHFRIQATLDAYEGDSRIFAKSWDERIARDHL